MFSINGDDAKRAEGHFDSDGDCHAQLDKSMDTENKETTLTGDKLRSDGDRHTQLHKSLDTENKETTLTGDELLSDGDRHAQLSLTNQWVLKIKRQH